MRRNKVAFFGPPDENNERITYITRLQQKALKRDGSYSILQGFGSYLDYSSTLNY